MPGVSYKINVKSSLFQRMPGQAVYQMLLAEAVVYYGHLSKMSQPNTLPTTDKACCCCQSSVDSEAFFISFMPGDGSFGSWNSPACALLGMVRRGKLQSTGVGI